MSHHRFGFTLIELLISTAIFALVIIAFIGVFVAVVGVQTRQLSAAAVNEESQFLLQKIQYYVELSSFVSTTQDLAVSTLTLRMPSSTIDPTVISLAGGTAYLQQAGGALQPLTSNKVAVSNLLFTRRSNAPGHDSVSVSFMLSYNTASIKQMFVQALQTSVARVSAATFDSNVLPSTAGTLSLGATGQTWTSVNGVINFSGTNVGINAASPQQALEVNGGLRLNTVITQPTCNSSARGTLWFAENAPTANDVLQICTENASSTYPWLTVSNPWSATGTAIYYNGGNVGIGTNVPGATLDVVPSTLQSGIRTGGAEIQSYGVNNSWYGENMYYNSGAGGWIYRNNGYGTLMHMSGGAINFQTFVSGTAGAVGTQNTVMSITNAGSVGIGTTVPTTSNGGVGKTVEIATGADTTSDLVLSSQPSSGSLHGGILEARVTQALTGGDSRLGQLSFTRGTDQTSGYLTSRYDMYLNNNGTLFEPEVMVPIGSSNMQDYFQSPAGGNIYLELGGSGGPFAEMWVDPSGNFFLNENGVASGVMQMIRSGAVANTLVLRGGNVGIGTTVPNSKLEVTNGDIDIATAANGLILKDTVTGTCARVQLTNGVLVPTTVTCP